MPYQRKRSPERVTISPSVDRALYYAVLQRGFSVPEVIDLCFAALLEIDDENLVRYDSLQKTKERLQTIDYKDAIQRSKNQIKTKSEIESKEFEKKRIRESIYDLVCAHKPSGIERELIRDAVIEGRDTSKRDLYMNNVRKIIVRTYPDTKPETLEDIIYQAIKNDWC